jgi:hypothetical protein
MGHLPSRVVVGTVLATALALGGCGSDEGGGGDAVDASPTATESSATPSETASASPSSPTEEPSPAGTTVEVTVEGGQVSPSGERVRAGVGEPVTFAIDADSGGELHAHSSPEQEIAFDAGRSEHTLTFDRPGVVEVELHDPAVVVVQLEVR